MHLRHLLNDGENLNVYVYTSERDTDAALIIRLRGGQGFNFFSHGSQDIYPSYMQKSKGLSAHLSTIATIIGNCGAVSFQPKL